MAFGIDTFQSHLDLIDWDPFKLWNGGEVANGKVSGGDMPSFAGRNFLGGNSSGGDFLWGHGEATDAKTTPKPNQVSQLHVTIPLIAPIQAPLAHQQMTGQNGHIQGKIDADAFCQRLQTCLRNGELVLPLMLGQAHVWLSVDAAIPLTLDYWAGWSDYVNTFAYSTVAGGFPMNQPFRACIRCDFSVDATGKSRPDPHVTTVLNPLLMSLAYWGKHTTCYAFWAVTQGVTPPDWGNFDPGAKPIICGFLPLVRNAQGNATDAAGKTVAPYAVDTINPDATLPQAEEWMLSAAAWQPSVAGVVNYGFITDQTDGITQAQVARIQAHPIPPIHALVNAHESLQTLAGGSVNVIGRYLKFNVAPKGHVVMQHAEAQMLSEANFQLFTVFEDINLAVKDYIHQISPNDPDPHHNGQASILVYFNPLSHAGTEDGTAAFAHCGDVLGQPAHTPVYFTVDFDAGDPGDARNQDPFGHPLVAPDSARSRIEAYFTLVRAARDAYALLHPGRYYTIGVYASGTVMEWLYEQGIVSMFWQTPGPGSSGNQFPTRPWYHANRWQFNIYSATDDHNHPIPGLGLWGAGWTYVSGADPDADWGDGGTWSLTAPLVEELVDLQWQQFVSRPQVQSTLTSLHQLWDNLVQPPAPPAAPDAAQPTPSP